MSERKVLNKYYPPDFDPSKIPRNRRPKDAQHKVRLMAPFSMRCNTCGEYIYKGKKFNARKENAQGEEYLGIQIFRFYIRCTRCSAEITFKTDPKNSDYVCEQGAARNFEPWRDEGEREAEKKRLREEEEENNPMKALENRTLDSKREIEIMNALEDIRTLNSQKEKMAYDEILGRYQQEQDEFEKGDEIEEEEAIKSAFGENGMAVKRLADSSDEEEEERKPKKAFFTREATPPSLTTSTLLSNSSSSNGINKPKATANALGITLKKKEPTTATAAAAPPKPAAAAVNPLGLVGDYGSDSE